MTDPNPRTHRCPGGCTNQIPNEQLACKQDWYRLPAALRNSINLYHRRRDDTGRRAHRQAVAAAVNWYRRHPRTEP